MRTDALSLVYARQHLLPIADITALVTVDFAAKAINFPVPEELASLKRWYDLVSKRPSAVA